MAGIKETTDVAQFLGSTVSAVVDAARDGKFEWWEAAKFADPAKKLPAAVGGYDQVPVELEDLDEDEAYDLRLAFADSLDLPNDGNEALIEEGTGLALQLAAFINKVRKVKKAA